MAVRRAESSLTTIYDFFTVYSTWTWFVILLFLLVFMVFGVFVHFVEWRLGICRRLRIGDIVWRIFRLQMNQYRRLEFHLPSGMFALRVFSFLQCLIILNIYQNYIISAVVKFKDSNPFSPDDFLAQLQQNRYSLLSVG